MKSGQGFLLVFSITSLSSLNELYELREQIVRIKEDEKVPLVIVGNKSDLEEDRAVSRARAFAVSEGWGHAPYYETSARRRANVDEAFEDLCRQIIRKDMANAGPGGPPGTPGGSSSTRNRNGDTMAARDQDPIAGVSRMGSSGQRRRKRDIRCTLL